MIIAFPLFGFAQTYALPNVDNLDTLPISNEPIQNEQSSSYNVSLLENIGYADGKKSSKIAEDESNFLKKLNRGNAIIIDKIRIKDNTFWVVNILFLKLVFV